MHHRKPLQPSRRVFMGALAGAAVAPYISTRPAWAAEKLIMRTPGGERDDVLREVLYEPFRKETGIEIVPVSANTSKMVAMAKAGASEIDLIDNSTDALKRLSDIDGLAPIPYTEFKRTDPADIEPALRTKFALANSTYATVLGLDRNVYPAGKGPKSWSEFWDLKAFPGPRALGSMDATGGDLEMALLADGVPAEKLYPLDLDRAFKSLSRVRPAIVKFWESGAMSTQMLTDREVSMAAIWSTRLSLAIDKGAPLIAEWNQCRVEVQAYGILKASKNLRAAKQFVDFALSPEVQIQWLQKMSFVPANKKAYSVMPKSMVDPATGTPWTVSRGFMMDIDYWSDHQKEAAAYWSKWIVQ